MSIAEIEFEWVPGPELSDQYLAECAALYSEHYGVWGHASDRPGQRVRLGRDYLKRLTFLPQAWAALARLNGQLVGYAFSVREKIPDCGLVTWVTQLVVHTNHRNRGIATALLGSMWGFSDHCGWGLVTANPYAVRALEKATRRRCRPGTIQNYLPHLQRNVAKLIPYIKDRQVITTLRRSVIDTDFQLDLSALPEMLERATREQEWKLGRLDTGQEWFAFTFREQPEFPISLDEAEVLWENSDKTVVRAYESMSLDAQHKWAKHWKTEVEWIWRYFDLEPGQRLVDFGCGNGRHALELARRGVSVLGVDMVERFIQEAAIQASRARLTNVRFQQADLRWIKLNETFDYGICLYDVVGSHPIEEHNQLILQNLARHIRPGGKVLISVMNLDVAMRQAKHRARIARNPSKLLDLRPSSTMQNTGNIWNPDFYILDPDTKLVYRKEQFEAPGLRLPCELVVRDRRYEIEEFVEMCRRAGLAEIWTKRVQAGRWDLSLNRKDIRGKELLFLGEKR